MFNDKYGLTQAVLEGRKTITRRIAYTKDVRFLNLWWDVKTHQRVICDGEFVVARSQYKIDEVVAIAQSYNKIGLSPSMYCEVPNEYGGTRDGSFDELAGWENKMFVKADLMPHHIKITNIRVEHLQDISDEDCLREGIRKWDKDGNPLGSSYDFVNSPHGYATPREAFAALIDKVSGRGTWDSNPMVWVYEFELVD